MKALRSLVVSQCFRQGPVRVELNGGVSGVPVAQVPATRSTLLRTEIASEPNTNREAWAAIAEAATRSKAMIVSMRAITVDAGMHYDRGMGDNDRGMVIRVSRHRVVVTITMAIIAMVR